MCTLRAPRRASGSAAMPGRSHRVSPLHSRSAGSLSRCMIAAPSLSAALPQRSARARAAASRRDHPWHALAQAPDRAEAPLISHALRSPYLVLPAGLEPAHGEETPKTHPRGAPRRGSISAQPSAAPVSHLSGTRRPSPAPALSLRYPPSTSGSRPQPPALTVRLRRPSSTSGHPRPPPRPPTSRPALPPPAHRPPSDLAPLRLHRVRLSPVPRRTVKAQNSYDIGDWMQDP